MLQKRRNKYGNTKVTYDGFTFDSKKEAARWKELKYLFAAKAINGLNRQVTFRIEINGKLICKKIMDFAYIDISRGEPGTLIAEDSKGFQTREDRLKMKLCEALYPDWTFRLS